MSFLNELKYKKTLLKNTETVVTCADGKRFIDCKNNSIVPLEQIKYGFVVDNKPDNIPSLVMENVYLGSQDCCELRVLIDYNIKVVLSIGIKPIFDLPDVSHTYIECLDLPEADLKHVIYNCIPIIRNATKENKNILIHCNAGVSRSSAVVIGFLILEHNFTYLEAYNIVKKARTCIKPNVGFENQLKTLCM